MTLRAKNGYWNQNTEVPAFLAFYPGEEDEPHGEGIASRKDDAEYSKPMWLRGAAEQYELGKLRFQQKTRKLGEARQAN